MILKSIGNHFLEITEEKKNQLGETGNKAHTHTHTLSPEHTEKYNETHIHTKRVHTVSTRNKTVRERGHCQKFQRWQNAYCVCVCVCFKGSSNFRNSIYTLHHLFSTTHGNYTARSN